MDLIKHIHEQVSQLPSHIMIGAYCIMGFFLLRSLFSAMRLRLISAATNVLYALIVGLALSRYGVEITEIVNHFITDSQRVVGEGNTAPTLNEQNPRPEPNSN